MVSLVLCFCCHGSKVLKQIGVGDLHPDETVDAVREARLLAKVTSQHTKRSMV